MWKNSVRFEWNRLLAKSGLLNGHSDPPTTKIHSTYRVLNMAAYLTKYFIKGGKISMPPQNNYLHGLPNWFHSNKKEVYLKYVPTVQYIRPINGRLWGCSHSLSQARNFSYIVDGPEMQTMNYELRKESTKETQRNYCNMFYLKPGFYDRLPPGPIKTDYLANLLKIRKTKYLHQFEIYGLDGELITDKKILLDFHKNNKHTQQKISVHS